MKPAIKPQSWVVAAAFFTQEHNLWLDDFIADPALSFQKIAPPRPTGSWHQRPSQLTSASEWLLHLRHAQRAMRQRPDGIVTCFPQLAMCAALLKKFSRKKPRLIAYNYNLGELLPGRRQRLARFVAREIDRYIVHSPAEIESYSRYLDIPRERLVFAPLHRGAIPIPRDEDTKAPFLVAMGSAHRDYRLLIAAVDRLGIKAIIIARADLIDALPKSPHVTFMSGLSEDECLQIMARARICVTPIKNQKTSSGQVTFIQAMQLGVPTVTTRSPGTDGYFSDEESGILIAPDDLDEMVSAISRLWTDATLRTRIAARARAAALSNLSDEAAAERLRRVILSIDAV